MGKSTSAVATYGSYPSPDSENDGGVSAASPEAETSPAAAERDASACDPVSAKMQRRANRRQKSHSPEVWEDVKPHIEQLYLRENLRLKDVMAILVQQQGFHASVKMYKTKLAQWKFFKNNRQIDVASILKLQRQRQKIGKDSTFRRNGRPVNLDAYIKRSGLPPVELLKEAQLDHLPPTVRCRTPSLREMPPPDELRLQEAYITWSTDQPFIPPSYDAMYLKDLDRYHKGEAMNSVSLLTHGCWLLTIGRISEGGELCRRAFTKIDLILDRSAHFAVYELFGAISRYPDPGIYRALWQYLVKRMDDMGRVGRVNQKLRRILDAFAKLSQDYSLEYNVAMLQLTRRFSSEQGRGMFDGKPFDYTLIQPWDVLPMDESYYHRYYLNQKEWKADEIPTATLDHSLEGVEARWNLRADLLIIFGNQTAWMEGKISRIALKMLGDMPQDPPPRYSQFVCYYAMALNNRALCRGTKAKVNTCHKLAREYLQAAAKIQCEAWEPGKNYYETLTLLESWHLEAGDEDEAEKTRLKRDRECHMAFQDLRL
ncbi:hypothetical protein F5Y14DRAFT_431910 [Nemania sp. NC0429]|nr:hypothetical protein F5Y14DRAFT_431910 [Nemania sp. NC0429]